MVKYYVLKGHEPILEPDLLTWAHWLETSDPARIVAHTKVSNQTEVSTVFLGLDHSFGDGPSLLFETMIFGGRQDGYQKRYPTWVDAEAGHTQAVRLAKRDIKRGLNGN